MEAAAADGDEAFFETVADIFGHVVTTEKHSDWFLECARGTNNTGEICGIIQALLWLLNFGVEDDKVDATILYDSRIVRSRRDTGDQEGEREQGGGTAGASAARTGSSAETGHFYSNQGTLR